VESMLIEPVYKKIFYISILVSIVFPAIVSLAIFVKERSMKEIKLLLLVLTQIPIVFGVAMFTQFVFPVGWVVDLQSVFGLFASVVIVYMSLRFEKTISMMKGLKYLDWIVFAAGFAVLLTPLKGFGLSLLVGLFLKNIIYSHVFKSLV